MTRNKAALVTGSGKNIGRSTAIALGRQGYDVVVTGSSDREACEETALRVRECGVRAAVIMADLGNANDVRTLADGALAEFGSIDVFVANAAIRPRIDFLSVTPEHLRHIFAVNLESVIQLSQSFLPGMIGAGWGRIVLFTGRLGIRGAADEASLAVTKHGIWGLTKSLAKEFGGAGVTTNAISPGSILTERKTDWTEKYKAAAKEIPVGRNGSPEEIAAVCSFLASKDAAFINGQMIGVNGGVET